MYKRQPVIRLEDGFVRSLDLGVNGEPPLSLVVDDCGIYYDASKPAALEKLVQDKAGNTALISQAREAMHLSLIHICRGVLNRWAKFGSPSRL